MYGFCANFKSTEDWDTLWVLHLKGDLNFCNYSKNLMTIKNLLCKQHWRLVDVLSLCFRNDLLWSNLRRRWGNFFPKHLNLNKRLQAWSISQTSESKANWFTCTVGVFSFLHHLLTTLITKWAQIFTGFCTLCIRVRWDTPSEQTGL